jgi:hypothetical protein
MGVGHGGLSLATLMTGGGGHLLGLSLGGGEVHHHDPLRLKHGLMTW